MPVKGLHAYLHERRLISTDRLESLRSTKIGIDGMYWLRKVYNGHAEPLQLATGGVPLSMKSVLRAELEKFKTAGICPVFLFPGLNPLKKEIPFHGAMDRSLAKREAAWEQYCKGDTSGAVSAFAAAQGPYQYTEFIQLILQFFRENNVEFLRAPYSATAQLAYFSKMNMLHAVYGIPDLLMYGAPRVITEVEFENGTFDWVGLSSVMRSTQFVSEEQFLDACILSSFEALPTPFPSVQVFQDAVNLIHNFKSGYYAVINSQPTMGSAIPPNYLDNFLRARASVRHHLILEYGPQGVRLEPLVKDKCPCDIHEVVGPRLPMEVLLFLANGIVSPYTINNIISGLSLEYAPNLDTMEYHQLLDNLVAKKATNIGLVTSALHPDFKNKKISSVRWYDPRTEVALPHQDKVIGTLFNWQVKDSDISAEFIRQKKVGTQVNIAFILKWHQHITQSKLPGHSVRKQMEKLSVGSENSARRSVELQCMVLVQALEIRGYLALDQSLTQWGRALVMVPEHFTEPMSIMLELLQDGSISSDPMVSTAQHPPYALVKRVDKKAQILLLSRVFSLLNMDLSGRAWEGPVDYDLMQFSCIVRSVHRCARNLMEMLMLSLFLRQRAQLEPHEYAEVASKLPYTSEPSTHMGVMMKALLEGADLPTLKSTFPNAANVEADVRRALEFWDSVMSVLGLLKSGEVSAIAPEIIDEFESANAFIAECRKSIN